MTHLRLGVWPVEPELVAAVRRGDGSALATLFDRRISACAKPFLHFECFTDGPFGDLGGISSEIAFLLVPSAVDLVLTEPSSPRIECALALLSELVGSTLTTELPTRLEERWDALAERARSTSPLATSFWSSVAKWYRR